MDNPPRVPSLRINKIIEDEDGSYTEPVTSPVCDMCLDMYPNWDYGCADFVLEDLPGQVPGSPWASSGHWAICQACSELIDQRNELQLVERQLYSGQTTTEWGLKIVRAFYEHMDGTKTAFG